MADFQLHTADTAPDDARDFLAGVDKKLGFIPSLYGVFAENPAVLHAYVSLGSAVEKSGLNPLEQQVAMIAVSVANECHFCVAAHTTLADNSGLDMAVISAIREDRAITDPRLEALRLFTRKVVIDRGFVSDCDVETFIKAGWNKAAVLAVILIVAFKVISNYTNHVAETPVNEAFQKHAWTPGKTV